MLRLSCIRPDWQCQISASGYVVATLQPGPTANWSNSSVASGQPRVGNDLQMPNVTDLKVWLDLVPSRLDQGPHAWLTLQG